jgi:hypothetical protein
MIKATKITDSLNTKTGNRLTTFRIRVPKFLLAEINTHRALSRNFASARAIPAHKIRDQVMSDPFIPIYWGQNQKGMQAKSELTGIHKQAAITIWKLSRWLIPPVIAHWMLDRLGLHKQTCNRLLEPYMWADGIISATEWQNFFRLRDHEDAQPEFRELARQMRDEYENDAPMPLDPGEWHLPMIEPLDVMTAESKPSVSAARCARVSYLLREQNSSVVSDLALCKRLSDSGHLSPFEHQAIAISEPERIGNFVGFRQYRKTFEGEAGGDYAG